MKHQFFHTSQSHTRRQNERKKIRFFHMCILGEWAANEMSWECRFLLLFNVYHLTVYWSLLMQNTVQFLFCFSFSSSNAWSQPISVELLTKRSGLLNDRQDKIAPKPKSVFVSVWVRLCLCDCPSSIQLNPYTNTFAETHTWFA